MIAIPVALTLLRLLLGPLAIALALMHAPRMLFAPLLIVGMLSDVLDGVVARKLGVVRPWMRRLDSITDLAFYLCIFASTWIVTPEVVKQSVFPLSLLLASEAVCYLASFFRFGVFPATHSYLAKIYGLAIFAAFTSVLAFGAGPRAFIVLAAIGLTANAEIFAILVTSRTAPVDVGSIFSRSRESEEPFGS